MDLLRQAAKTIQLHLLHTSSRLLLFSRLPRKLKEDFQSTHQLVFKRKTARESLVKLDIDILHKDGLQFHLAAPIQSKNRDRVTYCVTWVVNWVSAALGYIKLTSAYSRLEKLWVRFGQTLFFLCIWTLLFFASCSTVWIILGPGPSFPFSLSISFPFHTCQSLFTPVGKGCFLENLLMETSQAGVQLQSAWSPHQIYFCWDTGTTSIHRIRIVAQINGPWPGTDQGKPHFFWLQG